jgi:hypothetical protein
MHIIVSQKSDHQKTARPARLQDAKTFRVFEVSKLEKDMDDRNLFRQKNTIFRAETHSNIADIQNNNKYFTPVTIFIKLKVLKLPEKNYFCGGKFRS